MTAVVIKIAHVSKVFTLVLSTPWPGAQTAKGDPLSRARSGNGDRPTKNLDRHREALE